MHETILNNACLGSKHEFFMKNPLWKLSWILSRSWITKRISGNSTQDPPIVKGSSGQDRTSLKACVFPRIRFVMFTAILSLRYRAQYLAVLTHVCYINPYIILSRCGADAAFWALHGTRAH